METKKEGLSFNDWYKKLRYAHKDNIKAWATIADYQAYWVLLYWSNQSAWRSAYDDDYTPMDALLEDLSYLD